MIEIIKGDTLPIKTSLKNGEGQAIDIEDIKTIYCTFKKYGYGEPIFQKTLEDMEYTDGVLHIVFESEDTQNLNAGDYVFDIEVTLISGYRKTRVFEIRLLEEVTNHG